MKRTIGKCAVLGLALAMTLSLAACSDAVEKLTGIDGKGYMQGQMDMYYLGKYSKDYMDMVNMTESEAEQEHQWNLDSEAEVFANLYGVDYPTDEFMERMSGLFDKIFAKADYTVVSSNKQTDDSYAVKITVRPLDTIQLLDAALADWGKEFKAAFEDVDIDAMTDEEYNDWYQNEYDLAYQNGLADQLEAVVDQTGYLPEKSITVQIEKDPEDGYFVINENDFSNLHQLILDYSSNVGE